MALTFAVYRTHDLSVALDGIAPNRAAFLGIMFVVWVSFLTVPGPRRGWFTAEAVCAFLLTSAAASIVAPAQYAALAIGRPFLDEALVQADAAIRVDVSTLWAWAQGHPRVLSVLLWAYGTLKWQLLLAIPTFWLLRDRGALWEYVFHFHFCLIVTLIGSALWPVAGPYQWFGYTTPIDLSRVVAQVNGFHDGTLTEVRWAELDGLISMPSFHTATGLFLTWAVRKRWWIMLPMLLINSLLILATVFTGIHYAADVFAAGLVFAGSLLAYTAVERHSALDTRSARYSANGGRPALWRPGGRPTTAC